MKSVVLVRSVLLGACLLCLGGPMKAQPQPGAQQIRGQWLQLRRTWSATELTDPQSAIAAYEKFYRSLSDENGDVAVEVVSRVAQLYGGELGKRDRALQIYEAAIKRWRAPELLNRLVREHDAMSGAAQGETAAVVDMAPAQETAPLGLQTASDVRAKAGTLVELLAAGQDAETVWASGQWTGTDVVWALEHVITDDGILRGRPREGQTAREALASLLARHGGELVSGQNWRALPLKARLWLGDYYRRQNDDKAVAMLESVLGELEARKSRREGDKPVFFAGAERLAQAYEGKAQLELAAQTWMRLPPLLDKTDWRVSDALIGAARDYKKAGQEQKAEALYAKVPQYGHGWFSPLSLYDQALPLMDVGKFKEAYALMSRPLHFTEKAELGVVAQQAWLASFAYQMGDLEAALKHGRAALNAGDDGSKLSNTSVHNLYEMARDIYNRAGGWRTQPIQTDTKEVVFRANPSQPNQPLYARFRIKTYGDTSITATVDNPAFQARVLPLDNWQREGLNAHEQEMEVVVMTSLNRPVANVPLMLSSAARGKTTTVRLSLREESPRPALSTGG